MKRSPRLILDRLRPSSRKLVKDIIKGHKTQVLDRAFQDGVRQQLTAFGWKPDEVKQAIKEIGEIAKESLI